MKTFISFMFIFGIVTFVTAFESPRYQPPETAATEEIQFAKSGLVRGINLGLLDELSGIKLERAEKQIPLEIIPISPKHTGLTSLQQPTLQWYISREWSKGTIEFTLNEIDSTNPDPVAKISVGGPSEAGIYQVNLAHLNVSLKAGKKYEWFLSTEYQGKKLQTWAMIQYKQPDAEFVSKLSSTPAQKMTFVLAEAGFWYDCIAEAIDMLNKNPHSEEFKVYRNALLAQIGLNNLNL